MGQSRKMSCPFNKVKIEKCPCVFRDRQFGTKSTLTVGTDKLYLLRLYKGFPFPKVVVRKLTHNNSFPLLTDKAKISEQTQSK